MTTSQAIGQAARRGDARTPLCAERANRQAPDRGKVSPRPKTNRRRGCDLSAATHFPISALPSRGYGVYTWLTAWVALPPPPTVYSFPLMAPAPGNHRAVGNPSTVRQPPAAGSYISTVLTGLIPS